jgi:hypothetical protein
LETEQLMRSTAGTGIGDHKLDFTWRMGRSCLTLQDDALQQKV